MISGLMILPFTVPFSEYKRLVKEYWKVILLVTSLQTLLNYSLFYQGLKLVPGALGAVIVGSQPLITALVSAVVIKDDRLTFEKIIAIVIGIAGVVLISVGRQAFRIGSAMEIFGVLMILSANLATSTSNVVISAKGKGLNPFVLSSFSLFTGGLVIYLLSLFTEKQPPINLPFKYWAILLWLSFVAAFAFSVWYKLLQRPGVRVSELNLWKFIIPAVGAVLSWIFIPGEKPELLTITGIVIITASLIIFFRRSNHTRS